MLTCQSFPPIVKILDENFPIKIMCCVLCVLLSSEKNHIIYSTLQKDLFRKKKIPKANAVYGIRTIT